jgi:hypothetical protein
MLPALLPSIRTAAFVLGHSPFALALRYCHTADDTKAATCGSVNGDEMDRAMSRHHQATTEHEPQGRLRNQDLAKCLRLTYTDPRRECVQRTQSAVQEAIEERLVLIEAFHHPDVEGPLGDRNEKTLAIGMQTETGDAVRGGG